MRQIHFFMTKNTFKAHSRLMIGILFSILFQITVNAQNTGMNSPQNASGAPAGSYSLTDFENVNLYSGGLNFNLPLLSVGGRGATQVKSSLTVDMPKWRYERISDGGSGGGDIRNEPPGGGGGFCTRCPGQQDVYIDRHVVIQDNGLPYSGGGGGASEIQVAPQDWESPKLGYGPGFLQARRAWNRGFGANWRGYTLTRLFYTTADGTEIELRDQQTLGQPMLIPPSGDDFSRGTVFISVDGSSATFIADAAVLDSRYGYDNNFFPSGWLFLPDGTKCRIISGYITILHDRNGNQQTYTYEDDPSDLYGDKRVTQITGSLGRQINFTYDIPDTTTNTKYDRITFKGFGGIERQLKIWKTTLGNAFRAGQNYQPRSYYGLFPDIVTYELIEAWT